MLLSSFPVIIFLHSLLSSLRKGSSKNGWHFVYFAILSRLFTVFSCVIVELNQTDTILVCDGERNLGRATKLSRGSLIRLYMYSISSPTPGPSVVLALSPDCTPHYKPRWQLFDQSIWCQQSHKKMKDCTQFISILPWCISLSNLFQVWIQFYLCLFCFRFFTPV